MSMIVKGVYKIGLFEDGSGKAFILSENPENNFDEFELITYALLMYRWLANLGEDRQYSAMAMMIEDVAKYGKSMDGLESVTKFTFTLSSKGDESELIKYWSVMLDLDVRKRAFNSIRINKFGWGLLDNSIISDTEKIGMILVRDQIESHLGNRSYLQRFVALNEYIEESMLLLSVENQSELALEAWHFAIK